MALFGLFKKGKEGEKSTKKGFFELKIAKIDRLTSDTVKVSFEVPAELKNEYAYTPGQYLNVSIPVNGKEERRSYSICSGVNEPIAIAVKAVENGLISVWFNKEAQEGQQILVSKPEGNFTLKPTDKEVVAIAAGSGITPVLAFAKAFESQGGHMTLFYGSRDRQSIIFKEELDQLKNTKTVHFLSRESAEGFEHGRITKETFITELKKDLHLLRADAFVICGPEEMIMQIKEALTMFGVADAKIRFELFTTPVLMKSGETVATPGYEGDSRVKAILDSEVAEFTLNTKGKTILEAVEKAGLDAPYSCKGGVCCSCKAKVIKGSAIMEHNYTLTDEEVREGYILTCQAHPASEELIISYDE